MNQQENNSKNNLLYVGIGGGIAILILIAIVYYFSGGKSEKKEEHKKSSSTAVSRKKKSKKSKPSSTKKKENEAAKPAESTEDIEKAVNELCHYHPTLFSLKKPYFVEDIPKTSISLTIFGGVLSLLYNHEALTTVWKDVSYKRSVMAWAGVTSFVPGAIFVFCLAIILDRFTLWLIRFSGGLSLEELANRINKLGNDTVYLRENKTVEDAKKLEDNLKNTNDPNKPYALTVLEALISGAKEKE